MTVNMVWLYHIYYIYTHILVLYRKQELLWHFLFTTSSTLIVHTLVEEMECYMLSVSTPLTGNALFEYATVAHYL